MLNDSIKNNFTLPFDFCFSDRKHIDSELNCQDHIGSAQNVNSPKYLIVTQQKAARIEDPNKGDNFAVFDKLNVGKNFVKFDEVRFLRILLLLIMVNMTIRIKIEIPICFYKEYIGGEQFSHFITYLDVTKLYSTQVILLRFQIDHINLKEKQKFEENGGATDIDRLFMTLIRHSEIKMVSDGNKVTEIQVS